MFVIFKFRSASSIGRMSKLRLPYSLCCVVTGRLESGRLRSLAVVNNGGRAIQQHNVFRPAASTVSRNPWNFSAALGEWIFSLPSPP